MSREMRKEGRKEGKKERRKEGNEGRKEGRNETRRYPPFLQRDSVFFLFRFLYIPIFQSFYYFTFVLMSAQLYLTLSWAFSRRAIYFALPCLPKFPFTLVKVVKSGSLVCMRSV